MEFDAEYLKLQADGAGSIDRNNVWSRLSVERAKHFNDFVFPPDSEFKLITEIV